MLHKLFNERKCDLSHMTHIDSFILYRIKCREQMVLIPSA